MVGANNDCESGTGLRDLVGELPAKRGCEGVERAPPFMCVAMRVARGMPSGQQGLLPGSWRMRRPLRKLLRQRIHGSGDLRGAGGVRQEMHALRPR